MHLSHEVSSPADGVHGHVCSARRSVEDASSRRITRRASVTDTVRDCAGSEVPFRHVRRMASLDVTV